MCLLFIVCIVCRCCCLWLSVVINVLFDLYVSSLRRGHASFLCIVPSLTDDLRRESSFVVATACGCLLFTSCVVTFICCGGFVVFVYGLYIYIYIYICMCYVLVLGRHLVIAIVYDCCCHSCLKIYILWGGRFAVFLRCREDELKWEGFGLPESTYHPNSGRIRLAA